MSELQLTAAEALLAALTAFDVTVAEHGRATAAFAERIAQQMGLDRDGIENCRLAGLLHDVGMLGTDPVTLNRPEMLAEPEWSEVQQHPAYGAAVLRSLAPLSHLEAIVVSHHERVDGSGYPEGRYGDEIPIEARIVAVADAFHTMTVPVVYRATFSVEAAVAELVGNMHSHFDAEVVEALGTVLRVRLLSGETSGRRHHLR